jgi:peroxiredoxin
VEDELRPHLVSRQRVYGCRVTRILPLVLALALACTACAGEDEDVAGGASDLPGPVPEGVEYAEPPASAPAAPNFAAELVDGTPIEARDLWANRPVVLVFTASFCGRCAEIHRELARVVDGHEGAIALLGIVGDDDAEAQQYADDLDLGHPVAVAGERVWLAYAAREPSLVALVSRGGKILRGWPSGIDGEQLAPYLEDLLER